MTGGDYHIIVKFRPCRSCQTEDPAAFKITDVPGSLLWQTERLCMTCQGAPRATHRCSGCDTPLQRSRTVEVGEHEWTLCKVCLGVLREVVEADVPSSSHYTLVLARIRGQWMTANRRCGARKRDQWLIRFDGLERIVETVDQADEAGRWILLRQQVI